MSFRTQFIRLLHLHGEKLGNAVAGTSADIRVLERDYQGKISRATGTDVPANTTAGYDRLYAWQIRCTNQYNNN